MNGAATTVAQLGLSHDTERFLLTAAVLGGFLLAMLGVYALGPWLKARVRDGVLVEVLQSVLVTGVGAAVGGTLVGLWGLERNVETAFSKLTIDANTAVLSLISLIALGIAYTISRVTKRLIGRGSERDAITTHQKEIAHHVVQVVVFMLVGLFVLALWQVNPGDLLLGAGAAGIVVGLAARQTLGAVLAGFVLLFSRPFDIGDWVLINDREGTVTNVSIFNTEIRTFDNEHVLVPNDKVTSDDIVNRSRSDHLRLTLDVGVDYDTDLGKAVSVAERAMRESEEVLDNPTPSVVMDEFGANAVVLTCRFWIDDPTIQHKWAAQNAVLGAVKDAFEREGIEIPFPQRTLSGRGETTLGGVPAREVENGAEAGNDAKAEADGDTDDGEGTGEEAAGATTGTDGGGE